MLLYNSQVSGNCYKVRLLLAHLGIPFERQEMDVVDRSDRPGIIGDANPALRVPTLILDDGRPLAESNAIMSYFAEGTDYLPTDRYDRAQVLQWLFFEQYQHEPNVAVARFLVKVAPEGTASPAFLAERQAASHGAIGIMDRYLQTHEWFAAGRYSIADIALYAYTHVAPEGGVALDDYAAVQAWMARVAAQPGHVTIDW
ncbi:MAG: glutathione S-transferase family protein [Solirubrobacteraceae bacterium]